MVFTEQKKLFRWRQVKRNKKEYSICRQFVVATTFGLGAPTIAHAAPTGGEITSGSGTITQSGTTTDILQATQRLDINWQTFDSAPDETINFLQPNSLAVAINRVLGGVPSYLEGALNANGRVFILNEAGIVFTQGATVNVAGLLATTAKDVDVNEEIWNFSGSGYGSVLNYGQINVSEGGFAVLAAPYVENAGVITADLGQIELAGTNTYTMDLRGDGLITFSVPEEAVQQIAADGQKLGVDNSGTLQARSGVVGITARTASELVTGAVNLSGVVDATSFGSGHDGGEVEIVSAGDIKFTGTSEVHVDGGIDGDGGVIKTWADGVNRFNAGATLTARGGEESGDGGFIELSGNDVRVRSGNIDAGANNGDAGTFLLDPNQIFIANGGAVGGSISGGGMTTASSNESPFTVTENTIESIAGGGVNVVLEADDLIYMQDLTDNFLDVGSGGITMRILNGDGGNMFNKIMFEDKGDTVRSTTGNILFEVNGTNGSAPAGYTGDEIDIGNIFAGGVGVRNAGNVTLNAFNGNISVEDITILASDAHTSGTATSGDLSANLSMYAGGNINMNGPVSVQTLFTNNGASAVDAPDDFDAIVDIEAGGYVAINNTFDVLASVHQNSGAFGPARPDALVDILAGTDITISNGLNVRAVADFDTGNAGQIRASANLDMDAGGNVTADGTIFVEGQAIVDGSANVVGLTRAYGFMTLDAGSNVDVDRVDVEANVINNGSNPGGNDAFAGLDITAGTGGTGGIFASDDIIVEANGYVRSATGRLRTQAFGNLIAQDNIELYGSSGFVVEANGTNLIAGGFMISRAELVMDAGNGGSGYINVANGDVRAEANIDYRDLLKSFVDGDASVTLQAPGDITIAGNLTARVTENIDFTAGDGPNVITAGGPDGQANANAILDVDAGTNTGDLFVGGLTEVLASIDKSGGSGLTDAIADADIRAGRDVILSDGISVNALVALNTAAPSAAGTGFDDVSASANLFIEAGLSTTDADVYIGDFAEVIASINADGVALNAGASASAFADAYIFADGEVNIGYGSSNGITVQAIANNLLSGPGPHGALAVADLDITASGTNTINIYGPGLTQANAVKAFGSGSATASASAFLSDVGNIKVFGGGFDVLATATASGVGNGSAFADVYFAAISDTGYIDIDGEVNVAASALLDKVGSGNATANALAELDAPAYVKIGGISVTANAMNGTNVIDGDVFANAELEIVDGNIAIYGGAEVEAVAINSAAIGFFATASAELDFEATNSAARSIRIADEVSVLASAVNLNGGGTSGSPATAHAFAGAFMDAAQDILINTAGNASDTGFSVVANAVNTANGTGVVGTAAAAAIADLEAGTSGFGSINITGDFNVAADAYISGPAALVFFGTDASAVAQADLTAAYDIFVDGDISITASAREETTSNLFFDAFASADLDVSAGTAAPGGPYVATYGAGDFTVLGNILVSADAVSDGNQYIDVDASADADALITAFRDINIQDGLTINANAFVGNSASYFVDAVADAGGYLFAGRDITMYGGASITATAITYAGDPTGFPGLFGYGGGEASANAGLIAIANLAGNGGNIWIGDGNDAVNVTAMASAAYASDGLIEPGSVNADALTLLIAQDITLDGDVTISADARADNANHFKVQVTADATGLFLAGVISGTGDITITGDTLVSANAELYGGGTTADDISSQGFADAHANLFMAAAYDILVDGDISVLGNVFASSHYGTGNNEATANLLIAAGVASPGGPYVATYGAGDFTMNGDIMVDATIIQNNGIYGFTGTGVYGFASNDINANATLDIDAFRDITIDGSVDVHATGIITRNVTYGLNFVSASADAHFDAGRDITITNDVSVTAFASNDSYGSSGFGPHSADAFAHLFVDAGDGYLGYFGGNVSIGGDVTVSANAYVGTAGGVYALADADAIAEIYAYAGNVTIGGDIDVAATLLNRAPYAGTDFEDSSAVAFLYINAGEGFASGDYNLTIGGDVSVSADAIVENRRDVFNADVYALAEAHLFADDDISISALGTGTDAIHISANAQNSGIYGSEHTSGDASAFAILEIQAGFGSHGNLDVDGGINVEATAFESYGISNARAFAVSDVYIQAADDITMLGDRLFVTAEADRIYGDTSGGATALAFLNVQAGAHGSSGDLYVDMTDTLVSADAYSSTGDVFALVDISLTAADNLTFYGDSLTIQNFVSAYNGDATAITDLYLAAGTHASVASTQAGNLYVDIRQIQIGAGATVYGDFGNAFASADITMHAADDLTFYASNVIIDVDAIGPNNASNNGDATALANLYVAAGTHGSDGSMEVRIDNGLVVSAFANTVPDTFDYGYANAMAVANATFTAADKIEFYGNFVNVEAIAITGSGRVYGSNPGSDSQAHFVRADALASLYVAAGTHAIFNSTSGNDLYVDINNLHVTAAVTGDNGGTSPLPNGLANVRADANAVFKASRDVTFYGDSIDVTAIANTRDGTLLNSSASGQSANATGNALLYMAAGTHGSNGNLDVHVNDVTLLASGAANRLGNSRMDATAKFTAADGIDFYADNIEITAWSSTDGGPAGQVYGTNASNNSQAFDVEAIATATLYMAAGTHAQFASTSGSDLVAQINNLDILAHADAGILGNATADASAILKASRNLTFTGTDITINSFADTEFGQVLQVTSSTQVLQEANAVANATLYMAAGTHGSDGSMNVTISNLLSVSADATGTNRANVTADAEAKFTAADNLTFTGYMVNILADADVGNGAVTTDTLIPNTFQTANEADANANATLYMAAGTHAQFASTSGADLDASITYTLISANANAGSTANAFATAEGVLKASRNLTFTGTDVTVQAYAEVGDGVVATDIPVPNVLETVIEADAIANATLYMAAGTHGSDGSLDATITNTLVFAGALAGSTANATADALAKFTAADNLTFSGDTMTVLADADAGYGVVTTDTIVPNLAFTATEADAHANATLYMAAGTHAQFASTSGADLDVSITTTLVSADAYAGSTANALASAGAYLTASRNLAFTGTDVTVQAYAEVGHGTVDSTIIVPNSFRTAVEADAVANATLYMAAGTHGSDGSLDATITNTLVFAGALAGNTANATADALAKFTAADNLTFSGDTMTVQGYASVGSGVVTLNFVVPNSSQTAVEADANAFATLYMAAGTHAQFASTSGYDLDVSITTTLVSADADAGSTANALASAGAFLTASRNLTFTGTDVTVQGFADARDGAVIFDFIIPSFFATAVEADAVANATLYMAAGTHGSDGSMDATITNTLVFASADAIAIANATANALAKFTAADNLTFSGDTMTVQGIADVGNGVVTTDSGVGFTTRTVTEADANANATLYMAAGTHAQFASTSGYDLDVSITTTLVSADASAGATANAIASAGAYLTASRNLTFTGDDVNVFAEAVVREGVVTTNSGIGTTTQVVTEGDAVANATLYMAAGTHGSDGSMDVTISSILVSADAIAPESINNATANALAKFTAADSLTFTGDFVTVLAEAGVRQGVVTTNSGIGTTTRTATEADANANATLYMAAGTHAQFASTSGADLDVSITTTLVSADAYAGDTANALASAGAYLTASRNLTFTGTDVTVQGYADVGSGVVTTNSGIGTTTRIANEADAVANATLYMAAGTHGSDGSMNVAINNTLIFADALATEEINNATANALAKFTAADNLTFAGDYVTVFAEADVQNGVVTTNSAIGTTTRTATEADANANATLYMAAGTHAQFASTSGADLDVNITYTLVSADAEAVNTANAFADAGAFLTASRNLTFTGTDVTILADATASNGVITSNSDSLGPFQRVEEADAVANATLYMAAGTHGSDGFMNVTIDTTLVSADAVAEIFANATADALAKFTAADNLTFAGNYVTVLADAGVDTGAIASSTFPTSFINNVTEADANANATLYMAAGTHAQFASTSGYDLDVSIAYTLISADAEADFIANANANAGAYLTASRDLTFTGIDVTVLAKAETQSGVVSFSTSGTGSVFTEFAVEADAVANATLYMAAGTHGSDGSMNVSINNTLVSAEATASEFINNATANALAKFTAADNLTFAGDYVTVVANAFASDGTVIASSSGFGSVYAQFAVEADANANATLYMAAGTHAQFASTSGADLDANITYTQITANAFADDIANAYGTAAAVFKASHNLTFTGTDITVHGFARVESGTVVVDSFATASFISSTAVEADAVANATLYMAAGTHGSDGSMNVSITNLDVSADASGSSIANASANALAKFTAADNLTFTGYEVNVLADASVTRGIVTENFALPGGTNTSDVVTEADARANATLYMAAGTHAQFASTSGFDLVADITYTTIDADANGNNIANAIATADAVFKASRNVDFTGNTIDVSGSAQIIGGGTVFDLTSATESVVEADAQAFAALYMAAGTHGSDGNLLVTMQNTSDIYVHAQTFVSTGVLANGTADAAAKFTAADNLGIYGEDIRVFAFAENRGRGLIYDSSQYVSFNDNNANATLYIAGGTHAGFASTSGADVFMDVGRIDLTAITVSNDHLVRSHARADAVIKASRNVTLSIGSIDIDASGQHFGAGGQSYASNEYVAFNVTQTDASLYIAAGTHGSDGSLDVDFGNIDATARTFVDVYAGYAHAIARADVTMTAADDIDLEGSAIRVNAFSQNTGGGALYGSGSPGSAYVEFATARADADLYIAAGTHAQFASTSGADLNMDIYAFAVRADARGANADFTDGELFDINASADAVLKASRDIYIFMDSAEIDATAINSGGRGLAYDSNNAVAFNDAHADASLYIAAGTHGSDGSLEINFRRMEVFATANNAFGPNDYVDVHADASMTITAADSIGLYGFFGGDRITVNATVSQFSGGGGAVYGSGAGYVEFADADARADLYIAAGTHAQFASTSGADLNISVFRISENANVVATGDLFDIDATADAVLKASRNVGLNVNFTDIRAQARNLAGNGLAYASNNAVAFNDIDVNASLYLAAGTHGSNGSLFAGFQRIDVHADALNTGSMADVSAEATMTVTAADDVIMFGSNVEVGASADVFNGGGAVYGPGFSYVEFAEVNARADLYIAAGTHAQFASTSGALLLASVNGIDVYAHADGSGALFQADATADAVLKASQNVYLFANFVDVEADAHMFDGGNGLAYAGNTQVAFSDANAEASLYIAAGTHGSNGNVLASFNSIDVNADASASSVYANATALAGMKVTAADHIGLYGNTIEVHADGQAIGGANYGISGSYAQLANIRASADLYIAAGTHAQFASTSGANLVMSVNTIGVYGHASGDFDRLTNADADAHAVFKASRDVRISAFEIDVEATANVASGEAYNFNNSIAINQANADASLYIAAGTHGSNGSVYMAIPFIEVSADAHGHVYAVASANAAVTVTAADAIEIYGSDIRVEAFAEANSGALYGIGSYVAFASANANASLYIAAGTHAPFASTSGADLYVGFNNLVVNASASNDESARLANTRATADAVLKASRNVTLYGDDIFIHAESFGTDGGGVVYGPNFGSSNVALTSHVANASLYVAAGTHGSDGNLSMQIANDIEVGAAAFAFDDDLTNASANATATFTAADNMEIYANELDVYAIAFVGSGEVYAGSGQVAFNTVNANASLYMAAGTHGGSSAAGNLYVDIPNIFVDAFASGDVYVNATAIASGVMKAADDVDLYGSNLLVTANVETDGGDFYGSGVAYGNGNANASLYIAAGTHGSNGNLDIDMADTLGVGASAESFDDFGNVIANGSLTMTAADNATIDVGSTLGVYGIAVNYDRNGSLAIAGASMRVAAGTHGGSSPSHYGDLVINAPRIFTQAVADNTLFHGTGASTGYVNATATANFTAADDITITTDLLGVGAFAHAQAGSFFTGSASGVAQAYLGIHAGTHGSSGVLTLNAGDILTFAYMEGTAASGFFVANAAADLRAADTASINATNLTVHADTDVYAFFAYAGALADLTVAAGTHGGSTPSHYGDLNFNVADTRIEANTLAYIGSFGSALTISSAHGTFTAADDINMTGNSLQVIAEVDQPFGSFAPASYTLVGALAGLDIHAGTHGSSGDLNMNIGSTRVTADAYGVGFGQLAFASADASITAADNVNISGNELVVEALTFDLSSTAYNVALANLAIAAGTHGTGSSQSGDLNLNVANTTVLASAYAGFDNQAFVQASANADLSAANDVNLNGATVTVDAITNAASFAGTGNAVDSALASANLDITAGTHNYGDINAGADLAVNAFLNNNGTGSAFAAMNLSALNGYINTLAGVDVTAQGTNAFGSNNSGNLQVSGFMNAVAYGVNMNGFNVTADALCSGSSNICNPVATASGNVLATVEDIVIDGPINVQSMSVASGTGNTAVAVADLMVVATGGDITVSGANVIADAFINHGSAQASAYGNALIHANGSNTLNGDILVEANAGTASASGYANAGANLLVRTNLFNNNINGGLRANALVDAAGAGSSFGFARLELDAAGSNGLNIAGPGFVAPIAQAGGAFVQNVETDSDSAANGLAQLIIPHVITLDDELTRRMVVTYLGVTGFVLPTGFYISDFRDPGNGSATGGNTEARTLAYHGHVTPGTYRSTIFNLANGTGFGGFYIDDNGHPIFRASMGGQPDEAGLPYDEVCEIKDPETGRVIRRGWMKCSGDGEEPTFY